MSRLCKCTKICEDVLKGKTVNINGFTKYLLDGSVKEFMYGNQIEINIPLYSKLPIHISDLVDAYNYVEDEGRTYVEFDGGQSAYDDSLYSIANEIVSWILTLARRNDDILNILLIYADDDEADIDWLEDNDIIKDIITEGEYEVIDKIDRIIDSVDYAELVQPNDEQFIDDLKADMKRYIDRKKSQIAKLMKKVDSLESLL